MPALLRDAGCRSDDLRRGYLQTLRVLPGICFTAVRQPTRADQTAPIP
jgi:hypothetical protein